ncbi:hypothetical protein BRAS3843_1920015 [Bradyrhizobium sp. STM 3843]|nr:hypothetical protein BRAS3843_1920015 [Bradyrhizobium sp. STM 3843]
MEVTFGSDLLLEVTWSNDPDALAERNHEHQRGRVPPRFILPQSRAWQVATGRCPLYKRFQLGDGLLRKLL